MSEIPTSPSPVCLRKGELVLSGAFGHLSQTGGSHGYRGFQRVRGSAAHRSGVVPMAHRTINGRRLVHSLPWTGLVAASTSHT